MSTPKAKISRKKTARHLIGWSSVSQRSPEYFPSITIRHSNRYWLILLILVAIYLGFSWLHSSIVAQSAGRQSSVEGQSNRSISVISRCEIGVNGCCVEGKWIPVWIELENKVRSEKDATEFDGRLQILVEGLQQQILYSKHVELPPRSKRGGFIYFRLPRGFGANLRTSALTHTGGENRYRDGFNGLQWLAKLQFISDKGEEIAVFEKWITIVDTPGIIATVGKPFGLSALLSLPSNRLDSGSLKAKNYIKVRGISRKLIDRSASWHVANIEATLLPDNWLGYDAFRAIIISKPDLKQFALSLQQQTSLANWVRHGGQLIITTGADWQWLKEIFTFERTPAGQAKTSPLSDLMPIGSLYTKRLPNLSALSEWCKGEPIPKRASVICVLKPDTKDETLQQVILDQNDIPLIIRRRVDFGSVIFLAFDPTAAPFVDWKDRAKFWRKLLRLDNSRDAYRKDYSNVRRALANQISNFKQAMPLGLGYILFFMLVYIVVIGPLNYLAPKRFNITKLKPLIFLGSVLAFSLIAYVIIHLQKAGGLTMRSLAVVDVSPKSGVMRGTTYTGIFSPKTTNYTVFPNAVTSSIFPFEVETLYKSPEFYRTPLEISYSNGRFKAIVPSRIWSFHGFVSNWILPSVHDINESQKGLGYLAPILERIEVQTKESGKLKDSILVTPDASEVIFLGDLDAETKISDLEALARKHLRKECNNHISTLGVLLSSIDEFKSFDYAVNFIEDKIREVKIQKEYANLTTKVSYPSADKVDTDLKTKATLLALSFIADPKPDGVIKIPEGVEMPPISLRRKLDEGSTFLIGWVNSTIHRTARNAGKLVAGSESLASLTIQNAHPIEQQVCMVRIELDTREDRARVPRP